MTELPQPAESAEATPDRARRETAIEALARLRETDPDKCKPAPGVGRGFVIAGARKPQ